MYHISRLSIHFFTYQNVFFEWSWCIINSCCEIKKKRGIFVHTDQCYMFGVQQFYTLISLLKTDEGKFCLNFKWVFHNLMNSCHILRVTFSNRTWSSDCVNQQKNNHLLLSSNWKWSYNLYYIIVVKKSCEVEQKFHINSWYPN